VKNLREGVLYILFRNVQFNMIVVRCSSSSFKALPHLSFKSERDIGERKLEVDQLCVLMARTIVCCMLPIIIVHLYPCICSNHRPGVKRAETVNNAQLVLSNQIQLQAPAQPQYSYVNSPMLKCENTSYYRTNTLIMDALERKQLTVSADLKYTYYTSQPKNDLPTLLLLHGCPDTASLWSDLIATHLVPKGYGVVAPDLIGYGRTDKPAPLELYSLSLICSQVLSILDQEHLKTVIVLGHDFGAMLASKMYSYHPERVAGLITLGTAFVPPSPYPFDFEQIKAMQEQYQGYCSMWYFPLFTSENGASTIDAHLERMFMLLHGGGQRMKDVLCVEGGIEQWLSGTDSVDVLQYARESGFRESWIGRLKQDGWTAPLNWYKATTASLSLDEDKAALAAGRHIVKTPYLFLGATEDPLAPIAAVQGLQAQGLLEDVKVNEIEAGHWCMLEKPQEVGEAIVAWLGDAFKPVDLEHA
jgi:soluble epoxide hydrolase/lipid-phosphate phosphatase